MQQNIRNFCIVAHIDHGKSTLADRFLELTGAVEKRQMREQFLDQMELEREKGITIKLQPVRMTCRLTTNNQRLTTDRIELSAVSQKSLSQEYILNLVDTPGHVDFSYEVSRSLAAVEGAILLVDATKGVQAQTLANLRLAQNQGLAIIPAVNKVDLPSARIAEVAKEISSLMAVADQEIFRISAKTGYNVQELLESVIQKIPAPSQNSDAPLRALIFGSRFDAFLGIVAYVRVIEGIIRLGQRIVLKGTGARALAKEVGYFMPQEAATESLSAGEIGYIATGLKDPDAVRIGDTLTNETAISIAALPGYSPPKPVVFVSFYPQNPNEFDVLKDGLAKLRLQDPAFIFEPEAHEALGRGFRCGFLGMLHSEIISERIKREYGVALVLSRPSVEFWARDKKGREHSMKTASDWLDPASIAEVREPWARVEILIPQEFFSAVAKVADSIEARLVETKIIGEDTFLLVHEVPLREIVIDFYDRLKSATKGMASMDYQILDLRPAELVKLEILIAGRKEEAFSQIVTEEKAYQEGRRMVEKLKEFLPPQLFAVPLQAAVGGKIIARETIRAQRRDVIAPLYGGDVTRKKKLLEKQKKGKQELAEKGRIAIPTKVFLDVFRS